VTEAAHGPDVSVLLVMLAFVIVTARVAGALLERLRQPSVLGELIVGILIGNLGLLGLPDLHALAANETFGVAAEVGAILLLFQVGLESTPTQMRAVGVSALLVAVIGVVTPMILGYGVGVVMRPDESWPLHVFLGATLTATSVGITARVLGDLGTLKTRVARIILGAAVIDDVLGLVVLAVVAGIIKAVGGGEPLSLLGIAWICAKALLFLVGALAVGSLVSPRLFKGALVVQSVGLLQALSLGFCFVLAWAAARAGLAPIVGAYAAGLVLDEIHLAEHVKRGDRPLHETMAPLSALFVPLFFVRMGMLVDLSAFAHPGVLGFAFALTAVAAVGKLACAIPVPRDLPRMVVGVGMIPRGEVGLIFAAIGVQMRLGGRPVVDASTYAAVLLMVVTTTMLTPPLLAWTIRKKGTGPD